MNDKPVQWADQAMFEAETHGTYDEERGVLPKVSLVWMTPDPMGAIAAMAAMYEGKVVHDLDKDVTDDMRMKYWIDVQQTHLQAPLEAVKMHFMIDGVDRAFTHQLVRQRTAVYAQESMRFAVVGDLKESTTLPPSLHGTKKDDPRRVVWNRCVDQINDTYHALVDAGIPAEDARGLLPHCTATRINFITDLRNLKDHAGNRLCTQAQFHWRMVFGQIVKAVSEYDTESKHSWQFDMIAKSSLFRPVCFQLGKCPFKASFDRHCTIRDRVDVHEANGVPSSTWGNIEVHEWLADPTSARIR